MTSLLINYIKKRRAGNRAAFGLLSGIVGIVCNLLLCALKFTLGVITGAVSVTADAVNNLTDAGVNIVTIVGTKLAGKPEDKEHPFGHGRAEYIAALFVAFSVFIMSFELAKSAVLKLLHPATVKYSPLSLLLLLVAVAVKLWMAYFNRRLFLETQNLNMKAVMKDSLNDCIATSATVAVLVFGGRFGLPRLDGVIGCAVAVFVFFSGVSIVKEILGPLLGEPPSKELTEQLESIILDDPLILGVHDLIVHNYGPGRMLASAHAEVPADANLVEVHTVIDRAEKRIMEQLQVDICIHTDPVEIADDALERYKTLTEIILGEYNADFSFHDFRVIRRHGKTVLAFDLVTPFQYEGQNETIRNELTALYREKFPEAELQLSIEHSYTP